jgi:hypothetical protein
MIDSSFFYFNVYFPLYQLLITLYFSISLCSRISGPIGFMTDPLLTFTLSLKLKNTRLLQQTQGIKLSPQFYNFTPLDVRNEKIFNLYLFSCRGNTLEVAPVGAV